MIDARWLITSVFKDLYLSGLREQCSQASSPSVFGVGRDGLRLIVRLFEGARTDYALVGEDQTDYRGL